MKHLLNTLQKKWPEYLLEILVLIIGIYGAFALEEWNDSVQKNTKRESMRRSLISEAEANLNQLEVVLEAHSNSIKAGKEFIRLISEGGSISTNKGDSLLGLFYTNWTFDPINGALRTSISSGDIHLLKNEELLKLLFSWEDIVADATEDEDNVIKRILYNLNEPNPNIEWANVITDATLERSNKNSNYEALFADPSFKYFITVQILFVSGAMEELKLVKESNMRIIELLKENNSQP